MFRTFLACLLTLGIAAPLPAQTEAQTEAQSLTLKFLGPEDKPVAGATILAWVVPKPKDWEGTRIHLTTNENGIAVITYEPDGKIDIVGFNTKTNGYTPFFSEWNDFINDPIPSEYTVKLDKAETVGGIITDDTGKPLAGATIYFSFPWGERSRIVMGSFGCAVETRTDSEGHWKAGFIPKEHIDNHVTTFSLSHPDFKQTRYELLPLSRFAANAEGQFTEKLAMEKGITISGNVTDETGKPIAQAAVFCSNAADSFRPFRTTTNDEGVFSFGNCGEGQGQYIVVRADGFAPEIKNSLWFKADMPPIDIVIKPGKTLRAKVVDTDGTPIPKAVFFVERWGALSYPSQVLDGRREADGEGKFVWENAPAGEVAFTIQAGNHRALRGQAIIADDSEHTFTLRPAMKVSATVVDAKTGLPIPEFVIVTGYRFQGRAQISWDPNQPGIGRNGTFERHYDESYDFVIKIEAKGYAPSISREILLSETEVKLEFALEEPGETAPGLSLTGLVLDPDGKPAVRATVALARRNQSPYIQNGVLSDGANCLSARTDNEGRFTLPLGEEATEEENYKLFILHPSGFAEISKEEFESQNAPIILAKWSRVEGTVHVGAQPGRRVELNLRPREESDWNQPHAWFDYRSMSDNEGKFAFENVPPGKANVFITVNWGVRSGGHMNSHSHGESVVAVSGETAMVKLGGVGRPVIGKLTVPDDFEVVPDWNFSVVKCAPNVGERPDVSKEMAAIREKQEELKLADLIPDSIKYEVDIEKRKRLGEEWQETGEGKQYMELYNEHVLPLIEALNRQREEFTRRWIESQQRSRACAVAPDGTFRIEDVPAGEWTLTVELYFPTSPDQCGPSEQLGTLSLPMTISEIPGGQSDAPLDVGTLTLKMPENRVRTIGVGAEAPDFELKRLGVEAEEMAEKMVRLSDYRGKTVVLDFWATWCGPCLAQMPELVKFHEKIKENPDVVLWGISIDQDERFLLNFLANRKDMAWTQLRTDPGSPLCQQYGVFAVPTLIVVGPDGKVVAVNPGMRELERLTQSTGR